MNKGQGSSSYFRSCSTFSFSFLSDVRIESTCSSLILIYIISCEFSTITCFGIPPNMKENRSFQMSPFLQCLELSIHNFISNIFNKDMFLFIFLSDTFQLFLKPLKNLDFAKFIYFNFKCQRFSNHLDQFHVSKSNK